MRNARKRTPRRRRKRSRTACSKRIRRRGRLPNLSTFAFTATPKAKTLELFGRKRDDGKFEPFHRYSMRQAIEEGFILDVLENYTTYQAYWRLWKKIEDDPRYDKRKAENLLRSFVGTARTRHRREDRHLRGAFRRPGRERDRRTREGHDRDPLAPACGAHQARPRPLSGGEGPSLEGAGRLLRDRERQRPVLYRVRHELRGRGSGHQRPADGGGVREARVPFPRGREQVPDRLRPAASAHDVRGQEARRGERGADAVAASTARIRASAARWCSTSQTRPKRSGRRSSRTTKPPSSPRKPIPTCSTRSRAGCSTSACSRTTTWRLLPARTSAPR